MVKRKLKQNSYNMLTKVILFVSVTVVSHFVLAQKHVHGEGQLLIAQEDKQWQFQFVLPAADLLGFEHAPQTTAQHQQVAKIISKIEGVVEMLSLPAHCKLLSKSHSLSQWAAIGGDELSVEHKGQMATGSKSHSSHKHNQADNHDHENHHHESHEQHAHSDITVTYHFECENMLDALNVQLFAWAESLQTIDAQWFTAEHQGAQKLTSSAKVVSL